MEKRRYLKKLYFKQWVIGLLRADISDIIRTKNFRQDNIKWIGPPTADRFFADPFIVRNEDGVIDILYEDFSIDEHYGNISVMSLDKNLEITSIKTLLDTHSHLSFPFIFREDGRIFVIPESVKNGAVSLWEYDKFNKTLVFRDELIRMPLYDPAIFRQDDKYWLFGSLFEKRAEYKLHVFYSDELTGPYMPVRGNPVRSGLDGIRAAGGFIVVDGNIYRPAQNCENAYGESITINRLKVLDENYFAEEPYMTINISRKNLEKNNIHTIHTLNFSDDLIVVDGMRWSFSLKEQWKNFKRNRKILNQAERIEP